MTAELPARRTDDDTFAVIDDALVALAQRRDLWLGDDLVLIHLLDALITQAERCLPEAVAHRGREVADHTHRLITGTTAYRAPRRRVDRPSPAPTREEPPAETSNNHPRSITHRHHQRRE